MRPTAYLESVYQLAAQVGLPAERVLLGGDHLGPNCWQSLPSADALTRSAILVRDYVDARVNIGEFMIPVMFLVILLTFFPDRNVQTYGILALWAFFLIAVVDCTVLGFTLTRKVKAKFGDAKAERVRWYAAMRALQLRAMRLPKPQVKRGQYPS